jgi:hypothetical protein
MQQIAKEELAAVRSGDTDMLCRLTELLPHSLEELRQSGLPNDPETQSVLNEIRQAHEQAEKYLEEQMRAVRLLLQQCAASRHTLRAYGQRQSLSRLEGTG